MKYIAVALNEKSLVADSLEDTTSFVIYEIENKEIVSKRRQNSYGVDITAKIDYLKDNIVSTLFIGNILDEELDNMKDYGLEIYINSEGTTDYIVDRYLSGILDDNYEEPIFKDHEEDIEQLKNIDRQIENKYLPEILIPPTPADPAIPYLPFEMGEELPKDEIDEDHKTKIEREYELGQDYYEEEKERPDK